MKIKWLGQAGLLFEADAVKILVDPYLSNSCGKKDPNSYRRTPIDESYLRLKPDVIVLTHDHLDHTDRDTLQHYLTADSGILVLASKSAWNNVRSFGGNNNYVLFDQGTTWTFQNIRFRAVKAAHSDPDAIGVLINDGNKTYYVTGDTLYHEAIFSQLPAQIDTVFLPINGVGNNMNVTDAAAFARRTGAKHAVPLHFGMFDSLDPKTFPAENRVIPAPYEYIAL